MRFSKIYLLVNFFVNIKNNCVVASGNSNGSNRSKELEDKDWANISKVEQNKSCMMRKKNDNDTTAITIATTIGKSLLDEDDEDEVTSDWQGGCRRLRSVFHRFVVMDRDSQKS